MRLPRTLAVGLAATLLFGACDPPDDSDREPGPYGEDIEISSAEDAAEEEPMSPATEAPGPEESPTPVPEAEPSHRYLMAMAEDADQIRVFRRPGASRPFATLDNPDRWGGIRVFLVKEDREDGWLHVHLPMRPNGSTGWIREKKVDLYQHSYRVVVSIEQRKLRVYDRNRLLMEETVAVGKSLTPTPTGLFYTSHLAQPPDPTGVYGPYIFGLSGYSEILTNFGGGEGQIGIHGTSHPTTIGHAASNGCIRMHNEAIEELSTFLPLGTPVRIKA